MSKLKNYLVVTATSQPTTYYLVKDSIKLNGIDRFKNTVIRLPKLDKASVIVGGFLQKVKVSKFTEVFLEKDSSTKINKYNLEEVETTDTVKNNLGLVKLSAESRESLAKLQDVSLETFIEI